MITVDIPIQDPKKPSKLIFPDRCVNCGKPKSRTWPFKLNTGVQKSGRMIQMEMDVPLCADCSAKENRIGNVTWLPFFIVGLLTCEVVFIPAWLLSPQGSTPQTAAFPFTFGAFVGLTSGIIVGTLVEFGLRMLFAPTYGRLLLRRSLVIFSVFNDAEDLIGLSARFTDGRKRLKLFFENDDIAHDFSALNQLENS